MADERGTEEPVEPQAATPSEADAAEAGALEADAEKGGAIGADAAKAIETGQAETRASAAGAAKAGATEAGATKAIETGHADTGASAAGAAKASATEAGAAKGGGARSGGAKAPAAEKAPGGAKTSSDHAETTALQEELDKARAERRARIKAETRARALLKVNERAAEQRADRARAAFAPDDVTEAIWQDVTLEMPAIRDEIIAPPKKQKAKQQKTAPVREQLRTREDQLAPDEERRERPRDDGVGQAPWILALSSAGVLLVAFGYAGGRYHWPLATAEYWLGQIVVFTPVVARLLSRRLAGVTESFVLVIGLALNQYLLKWCYSPDQFRFPDELQHWLATTIINQTGDLFRPNPALPPAVHFPGLAEMGAALSQLTGLPVTAAGIIVAAVCHLTFVAAIFVTVLRATHSPAGAGAACAIYATSLHYLFFNSMYLYQTAALAFFMLTIWASRRFRAGNGWPFALLTVAGIVVTTICHHVTSGALVATLLLLGLVEVWLVRPRPWKTLILPGVALAVVGLWILLVARDVIDYLKEPLDSVMQTASLFFADRTQASSVTPSVSLWQLAVQAIGLLFLFVLFLAVARDTIARHDRDPWLWSALVGSVIFFAGNGVRFLGSNGPEIAGRLSTFTYVPIAYVAGVALLHEKRIAFNLRTPSQAPPPLAPGRTLTPRLLAGAAVITVLMIGARAGGWPPADQLLPGPYLAEGFERATDAYGIAAADYERDALGAGARTGGDLTAISLASTYGRQDPVREVGSLFYASPWTADDDALVHSLGLGYLVVDERLGEQLPTEGQYFQNDPGHPTSPLTAAQLGKFDDLPQWSRLYDNGPIRIYQAGGQ